MWSKHRPCAGEPALLRACCGTNRWHIPSGTSLLHLYKQLQASALRSLSLRLEHEPIQKLVEVPSVAGTKTRHYSPQTGATLKTRVSQFSTLTDRSPLNSSEDSGIASLWRGSKAQRKDRTGRQELSFPSHWRSLPLPAWWPGVTIETRPAHLMGNTSGLWCSRLSV